MVPKLGEVALRAFEAGDYPALAELRAAVYPEHVVSAGELRRWDAARDPRRPFARRVVGDGAGLAATLELAPPEGCVDPARLSLELLVHPRARRRGLGALLAHAAEDLARALGARRLEAQVRDTPRGGVALARRLGYTQIGRSGESELDLACAEWTAVADPAPRLAAEGFRLTSLASELDGLAPDRRLDRLRQVYAFFEELAHDVPDGGGGLSFEEFLARVASPSTPLEALRLARRGDAWTGLSHMLVGEGGCVYQALTGVRAAFRRRGLALALKLDGLRWARQRGHVRVRTTNGSGNGAILELNRRLGFRPLAQWIEFAKALDDPASLP